MPLEHRTMRENFDLIMTREYHGAGTRNKPEERNSYEEYSLSGRRLPKTARSIYDSKARSRLARVLIL